MYLTCPNCETVYAVRAAMLRDGQGEVRCGTCRLVFNALDSLSDELPTARVAAQSGTAPADDATKPIAGQEAKTIKVGGGHDEPGPAIAGDVPGHSPDGSPGKSSGDSPGPSTGAGDLAHAVVTRTLRDDLASLDSANEPVVRQTGLWSAAVLGLLALAFQYLWFAPEDLAARFPLISVPVESFCLRAGCMTRPERAPHLIRILGRDVRAHPGYEGALLVTATFSNAASWAQPFPALRFSLYDVNGRTIAARTFSPAQYLAGVLPANAPLPPGQPVQVALEMLAPEEAAVSFEFTFL